MLILLPIDERYGMADPQCRRWAVWTADL